MIPFMNRAMMTVGGGTVGVTTGGSAGMVVGATAGLAVDWLILQGTELLTKPSLERDVLETVNSTKEIITNKLLSSLLETVNFEHEVFVKLVHRGLLWSQSRLSKVF